MRIRPKIDRIRNPGIQGGAQRKGEEGCVWTASCSKDDWYCMYTGILKFSWLCIRYSLLRPGVVGGGGSGAAVPIIAELSGLNQGQNNCKAKGTNGDPLSKYTLVTLHTGTIPTVQLPSWFFLHNRQYVYGTGTGMLKSTVTWDFLDFFTSSPNQTQFLFK